MGLLSVQCRQLADTRSNALTSYLLGERDTGQGFGLTCWPHMDERSLSYKMLARQVHSLNRERLDNDRRELT